MTDHHKQVLQNTINSEKDILKNLREEYENALKEVEDVIARLKGRTDIENAQSIVYQIKYQEALKKQISGILDKLHGEEYTSIAEYLSDCYNDGFTGVLFELDGDGIPLVFPIDQEQAAKAIQLDTKLSAPLYKQIGENVGGLKKVISSSITRGIAAAMSYADIARQIRQYMIGDYSHVGGALSKAYTIARTEGHRIQQQAADDARHKARDKGADIKKQWDSTLDGRTRPSHRKVDGEIRELDDKFSNGLLFPGDPNGSADEVVNCRCVCLQKAAWMLDAKILKIDNFTKEIRQFDTPDDYADFKKWYFSKENVDYMKYVYGLEEKYGTKNMQRLLTSMTDGEYKHFHKLENNSPLWHSELRKKYLANNGNVSYNGNANNNQKKVFTKVKVEDIPPMNEKKFNLMKTNLERNGIAVIQDSDGDAYLRAMGAEAMTLSDGSAVIFQSDRIPSASAVYEEVIHTTQIRKNGMLESIGDKDSKIEYLSREIEANEKLLKHKEAYGLTEKDVESVQENLEMYYKLMKEVN